MIYFIPLSIDQFGGLDTISNRMGDYKGLNRSPGPGLSKIIC